MWKSSLTRHYRIILNTDLRTEKTVRNQSVILTYTHLEPTSRLWKLEECPLGRGLVPPSAFKGEIMFISPQTTTDNVLLFVQIFYH